MESSQGWDQAILVPGQGLLGTKAAPHRRQPRGKQLAAVSRASVVALAASRNATARGPPAEQEVPRAEQGRPRARARRARVQALRRPPWA